MPVTFSYEEEYKSRPTSITQTSFNQTFTFYVCGDFLEQAGVDPSYGPDDDLEALKVAYLMMPPLRRVPLYDGSEMFLVISDINLERVTDDTWKLVVTYSTPDFGGSGAGGYQQNVGAIGPNQGEQEWTSRFVQVSVNSQAQQQNKKLSLKTITCQKAVGAANQSVPYPPGKPAPIGWTEDEITGSEVYVRSFEFSLTAYFRPQEYNFAYVRRLYRMSTTLNEKTFVGYPKGSVLFLGHQASGDVYSLIPVTFDFMMRPNFVFRQNAPTSLMPWYTDEVDKMFDTYNEPYFPDAGGNMPGDAISGWAEVDYRYLPVPDNTNKMVLQKPILRTIHMNYEFSDFTNFGL